jgi:indolepyruvate ferredoxin oxidoreductase
MNVSTPLRELSLDDRYTAVSGEILLDGMQALVRVMLDLRWLDARRGNDTGVFVSGYPGSPLGGLDIELQRAARHLAPAGIVFRPGLNEELAATAVGGTQLLGELPGATKQGVTGFWYGKSPGFDRAADAIRHSNLSGTAPLGGAVALIGDDPMAKSSTVPGVCEPMCRSLVIPVLAPGTIAELLELGQHAVAISRHAGVWTGLKIVTELADSSGIAVAGAAIEAVPTFAPRELHTPPILLTPSNLVAEHDLFTARLERVQEYAAEAQLNRVVFEARRPRIGVVASGIGHQAVLRALADLGLDREDWETLGLRLVQLSMPWPLASEQLRLFADGLETVLVVEDKLPFVEAHLKEALYRAPHPPWVLGKQDREGRELLPIGGGVSSDDVAHALVRVLPSDGVPPELLERMRSAVADRADPLDRLALELKRTPYFCSGCPHNTSTRVGSEQLIGVGIGCHTMVALEEHDRRGRVLGMPQMGGEGAQWLGLAPFASEQHFTQNLGDGTFHHSGSLAIRAALAAGVNITYRLLYNDAVAMTGGQQPQGKMAVPELVNELAAEGVSRVVITTPEPERYHGVQLAPIASVRHRDEIADVQSELAAVEGVTVLIHDDRCATEKRRMRKRGQLETPPERVWINERVCEGCGDCGEKSSCLSVQPVQTEFGRKTRIHQSSCNLDMTCIKGDCPSFLVVEQATGPRARAASPEPPADLPEPVLRVPEDALIRMPGVGGTGVVTAAAILRTAAHLQGRYTAALDQTGLAQKGGPVISDLRLASTPIEGQIRASHTGVDVLIGFDLLGAVAPQTVEVLNPARTVAVLNLDMTPTASMVLDPDVLAPDPERLVTRVRRLTRDEDTVAFAAETLAEQLFGSHLQANMLLIGAAYQHGCLPLRADAIERALELNGASVEANVAAFRWGRAAVARPDLLPAAAGGLAGAGEAGIGAKTGASDPGRALADLLERYETELTEFQDSRYAQAFASAVKSAAATVDERLGSGGVELTKAYADGLFKLMAYKDEYEVARLHLDSIEQARLHAEFGDDVRVKVLLHPPLLRALGMKRKLRIGRSAVPMFRALRASRRLRGTAFDLFGRTEVRRVERALIQEYRALANAALADLRPTTAAVVLQILQLPDMVRGYEHIKLANVERMRSRAPELTAQLHVPPQADAELELIPAR